MDLVNKTLITYFLSFLCSFSLENTVVEALIVGSLWDWVTTFNVVGREVTDKLDVCWKIRGDWRSVSSNERNLYYLNFLN